MDIEYMYAFYSSYVYGRICKIFTDSCFCFSIVFLRLTHPVAYCSTVHVQFTFAFRTGPHYQMVYCIEILVCARFCVIYFHQCGRMAHSIDGVGMYMLISSIIQQLSQYALPLALSQYLILFDLKFLPNQMDGSEVVLHQLSEFIFSRVLVKGVDLFKCLSCPLLKALIQSFCLFPCAYFSWIYRSF